MQLHIRAFAICLVLNALTGCGGTDVSGGSGSESGSRGRVGSIFRF